MLKETRVTPEFIKAMDEFRKPIPNTGLLDACSQSVILFSEKMLGLRPYAWQVDFLRRIQAAIDGKYHTKEFLALTSRQIGKSTAIALLALWSCVFNKYPGTIHNNTVVGIASASEIQSRKLLKEIEKLMLSGDTFVKMNYPTLGEHFFTDLLSKDQANNSTTITFRPWTENLGLLLKDSRFGSIIKSYPPTTAVLGETFTIVIEDEAGLSEKMTDDFHYDYMYPTGNSTNAIRVYTSTPWVTSGFFYRLADPMDEFQEHPVDRVLFTYEAIKLENPKYFENIAKIIETMNRDGKIDEVQRAYMCKFVKGQRNYFDPNAVYDVFNADFSSVTSFSGECDMGIDFGGQVKSRTVITISTLRNDGKTVNRLYHKIYPVGKDLLLLQDIEELRKVFNIQRIIVDDCPAGDFLTRIMVEQKGWNVTPMNFRAEKIKKYGAFRASVNRREIKSYSDDELKVEMLALEFSQAAKQSLIEHAPGYSDDLIDSFLMSCYFFVQDEGSFKFHDFEMDGSSDFREWKDNETL